MASIKTRPQLHGRGWSWTRGGNLTRSSRVWFEVFSDGTAQCGVGHYGDTDDEMFDADPPLLSLTKLEVDRLRTLLNEAAELRQSRLRLRIDAENRR